LHLEKLKVMMVLEIIKSFMGVFFINGSNRESD